MKTKLILLTAVLAVTAAQGAAHEYKEVFDALPQARTLHDRAAARGDLESIEYFGHLARGVKAGRSASEKREALADVGGFVNKYNEILSKNPSLNAYFKQQDARKQKLDTEIGNAVENSALVFSSNHMKKDVPGAIADLNKAEARAKTLLK